MSSYAFVSLDAHLQAQTGHRADHRLSRSAADRHAVLQGLRERRTTASVRTVRSAGRLRRLLATRSGTSPA